MYEYHFKDNILYNNSFMQSFIYINFIYDSLPQKLNNKRRTNQHKFVLLTIKTIAKNIKIKI